MTEQYDQAELLNELTDEIGRFVDEHRKMRRHNKKKLIDYCAASLAFFKEGGLTHQQIRTHVINYID